MKKLFTILLLTVSCLTAFSQEKGSIEYGVNIGYNLSSVTSGSLTNTDFRSGLNIGAFGDYFFADRWSLKVKLSYDQKGWDNGTLTDLYTGNSIRTNYHFDYLTVPVMANWHFGKTKNWYLNFGPYAGFLLNAKETVLNLDLKDISNKVDLGLAFGIGVKIPVTNKLRVLLEVDGQSGFSNIITSDDGSNIKNTRSALNAGLAFSL